MATKRPKRSQSSDELSPEAARAKLLSLLSRASDEDFLRLAWAIDALQDNRSEEAAKYLRDFPEEAATSNRLSLYAVQSWELETLITLLMAQEKSVNSVDCGAFNTAADAVNYLRKAEDTEAGSYLQRMNSATQEISRIIHRQFPWQRGFFDQASFYRHAFGYAQGASAEFFQVRHGLTVADFIKLGFALFSVFRGKPTMTIQAEDFREIGLAAPVIEAGLKLLTIGDAGARLKTRKTLLNAQARRKEAIPIAYLPSSIRERPIIGFGSRGNRYSCPLPQLISYRITAGLYHDIRPGGEAALQDANDRFESYTQQLLQICMPAYLVERSRQYRVGVNRIDGPDVTVRENGRVVLAVECKATKLTFDAQFSEEPSVEADKQFQQIAKGVFQLWRFFSHVRRGIAVQYEGAENIRGIVATLESWAPLSRDYKRDILARAEQLAHVDPEILPEDRRTVLVCSVEELERTLLGSDGGGFLGLLDRAGEDRYEGWHLSTVQEDLSSGSVERRRYPFQIRDVLPWFGELRRD